MRLVCTALRAAVPRRHCQQLHHQWQQQCSSRSSRLAHGSCTLLEPAAAPCFQPSLPAENEAEDFLLSSYDATVCLTPASAAALRCADAGQPLLWTARYLPMGRMAAVEEAGVPAERLRPPPAGSSPWEVFGNGCAAVDHCADVSGADVGDRWRCWSWNLLHCYSEAPLLWLPACTVAELQLPAQCCCRTAASAGLAVGEEVEVQWKGRRSHPFGWWFGTVQSARGNRVVLVFRCAGAGGSCWMLLLMLRGWNPRAVLLGPHNSLSSVVPLVSPHAGSIHAPASGTA